MNFSILHWFQSMFGNNTNLFCDAVIVGNQNAKKVERQSVTWDIMWILWNAWNPTFYWPVRCTPCLGHTRQKKYPFQIDCKIFSEGRWFHVLAWYYVTNFKLIWTWNIRSSGCKCKKVSTVPHPPLDELWKLATANIALQLVVRTKP